MADKSPSTSPVMCLVLGTNGVGKTTLINKVLSNTERVNIGGITASEYNPTDRITLHRKQYLPGQIYYLDTPGRDLYQGQIEHILKRLPQRRRLIIAAMFDLTNRESLKELENRLVPILKEYQATEGRPCYGVLIGNKADLIDRRIISLSECQQRSRQFKFRYWQCSSLNDFTLIEFEQILLELSQNFSSKREAQQMLIADL